MEEMDTLVNIAFVNDVKIMIKTTKKLYKAHGYMII